MATRPRAKRPPAPVTERGDARERILRAAIALFRERGYHGTSMRTLARKLRVEAPSLYYHFGSKQDLLFTILDRTLDGLFDGLAHAQPDGDGPGARLRAAVRFHALFHARRRDEAFLSHSELRSLSPPNFRKIIARRDEYEQVFREHLAAGVRAGVFDVPDPKLTAMAILTMCTGVATWFSDEGRLAPERIADRYAEIVLRSVDRRRD